MITAIQLASRWRTVAGLRALELPEPDVPVEELREDGRFGFFVALLVELLESKKALPLPRLIWPDPCESPSPFIL